MKKEENVRFWGGDGDNGPVHLPIQLRQDPLQGDLGPQEGGQRGGEQLNFLPFRFSSFDLCVQASTLGFSDRQSQVSLRLKPLTGAKGSML